MFIDFETRNVLELPRVGARRYAQDPSNGIMCLGFGESMESVDLWNPHIPEAGVQEAGKRGARPADVRRRMRREIRKTTGIRVEYLEIVDPETLRSPSRLRGKLRVLGAVKIGNTRLIDNLGFKV